MTAVFGAEAAMATRADDHHRTASAASMTLRRQDGISLLVLIAGIIGI
jgi:hypothetical protein